MKRAILLIFVVALAGALMAAQMENCDLLGGRSHTAMSCPAAILPPSLVLGLVPLSLATPRQRRMAPQLVLVRAYHPPRAASAR